MLGLRTGAGAEKFPELVGEFAGPLVTLGPILRHGPQTDPLQSHGDLGVDARWWLGRDFDDLAVELFLVRCDKRQCAAEHAVEDNPQTVDVAARADCMTLARDLLG